MKNFLFFLNFIFSVFFCSCQNRNLDIVKINSIYSTTLSEKNSSNSFLDLNSEIDTNGITKYKHFTCYTHSYHLYHGGFDGNAPKLKELHYDRTIVSNHSSLILTYKDFDISNPKSTNYDSIININIINWDYSIGNDYKLVSEIKKLNSIFQRYEAYNLDTCYFEKISVYLGKSCNNIDFKLTQKQSVPTGFKVEKIIYHLNKKKLPSNNKIKPVFLGSWKAIKPDKDFDKKGYIKLFEDFEKREKLLSNK